MSEYFKLRKNNNWLETDGKLGQFLGVIATYTDISKLVDIVDDCFVFIIDEVKFYKYNNGQWYFFEKEFVQTSKASDELPLNNGYCNSGNQELFARGDHTHPSDTTKEPKISEKKEGFNLDYEDDVSLIKMNGNASIGS